MTDTELLRQRYRLLLHAYPRWYRRRRGLEILTTLLDLAEPGRRRPSWADALDIVGGGLRCRLRVDGWLMRCAAALIAWLAALAGAAAAGVLTGYSAPPSQAVAVAAAGVAVPLSPHDVPGPIVACDVWCPEWDPHDDVVAYDGPSDHTDVVRVAFHPEPTLVPGLVEQAYRRLADAGWRVTVPQALGAGNQTFEATKDGTRLLVSGDTAAPVGNPALYVLVSKNPTATVVAAVLASALSGLVAGWLCCAWVWRRCAEHGRPVRLAIQLASLPVLVTGSLMVAESALFATLLTTRGATPKDLLLPLFLLSALPPVTIATAACGAVVLLLAATPTGRRLIHSGQRVVVDQPTVL